MRVSVKKNTTSVEGKKIHKNEEGTVVAVTRDTRVCDDYYYILDFKDHGRQTINKNDLDV